MTTTKSYSKFGNIFSAIKTSVRQVMPFSIVTGVIFAILVHLPNTLLSSFDNSYTFNYSFYIAIEHTIVTTLFLALMTFIIALNLNGYLFSKSRTDFYHSLPIKRSSLLTSNFITAMIAIGAPYVAISLISMIIYGATQSGQLAQGFILYSFSEMLFTLLYMAIIYLFVTLVCVSVGTGFDGVILSGVIGFMPLFVYIIFSVYQRYYLYGYAMTNNLSFLKLSPFLFISQKYTLYYSSWYGSELLSYIFAILTAIVIIAILYVIAQLLYRVRKSEDAENKLMKGWPQIAAKIFIAFCTSAMFFGMFYEQATPVRFIMAIILAFAVSLVFEIILSRGVKAVKENLKWLLIGIASFCLLITVIMLDITGYEKHLPAPDNVASVLVDYYGGKEYNYSYSSTMVPLTDPEAIRVVVGTHANIIDKNPVNNNDNYDYYYTSFDVEYTLKNGKKLARSYYKVKPETLEDLGKLDSMPGFIQSRHSLFIYEKIEENIDTLSIEHLSAIKTKLVNRITKVSPDDYKVIIEALKKDLLNGAPVSVDKEEVIFNLKLSHLIPPQSKDYYANRYDMYGYPTETLFMPITKEYVNTVGALQNLGYI